jgi:HPt (histidine-containing phosphotransfer) domain-containing protein
VIDQPILDQNVLDELRASVGGDEEFVRDVAATFVAEGTDHMAQVEAAYAAGDLAAIVRPAHSLKSSSAALGATRLSQISRDIEFSGREERSEGLDALVAAAREAWPQTVEALKAARLVE